MTVTFVSHVVVIAATLNAVSPGKLCMHVIISLCTYNLLDLVFALHLRVANNYRKVLGHDHVFFLLVEFQKIDFKLDLYAYTKVNIL